MPYAQGSRCLERQRRAIIGILRCMNVRCKNCLTALERTCPTCHLRRCTMCSQSKRMCWICADPGYADNPVEQTRNNQNVQRSQSRHQVVNIHKLGNWFVEEVEDVRRLGNESSTGPGEHLQFLAQVRGWQPASRARRWEALKAMGDVGLRTALLHAATPDIL